MEKITVQYRVAFRVSENEVKVLYVTNDNREFVVTWNNIHASTGEVTDYDIQLDCLAEYSELVDRIIDCIREGVSDDNPDAELYYSIIEQFGPCDCETLEV